MKNFSQSIMLAAAGLGAAGLVGCSTMSSNEIEIPATVTQAPFGKTSDGAAVEIYTLRNSHGMEARIMTYGGIVTSLKVPGKDGQLTDVVLGFDNLDGYVNDTYKKAMPYFGALIGRYGNRIAFGKFSLDGQTYMLATNNGVNSLHGGLRGFDKRIWTATPAMTKSGPALQLSYLSKDGEEGYPGNLSVMAIYTLTDDNALRIEFTATTDKDTVCNLTHHSYFNLRGGGDILGHIVQINSDKFTPVDSGLIPTGELRPVTDTPFDFRAPHAIGERIGNTNDEQIKLGNGYDHNWVLNKAGKELSLAAHVSEPASGRVMEVWTTEPATQFYTGNFLDGTLTGKGGQVYQFRDGFCFEPQHYPDSPNHPDFPPTELKPGEVYQSTIVYRFSTE